MSEQQEALTQLVTKFGIALDRSTFMKKGASGDRLGTADEILNFIKGIDK